MKRYISFTFIMTLTACGSPILQSNIFATSIPDMEKVESECANTTSHEKNMHVTAVNCRFDAYEVILGERGFQEYNDLDTLKTHFIYIAKQQDAHKLTDEKALELFEKYTQEFYANLQRHDNLKSQVYEAQKAQTLAVIGAVASGLGSGLQAYSLARYPVNSTAYQPSCPACEEGARAGQANASYWQQQGIQDQKNMQSLQDAYHYNNPPPARMRMGQGARGYNGITGQGDTIYIPAGADPNPPPDVMR